MRVAQEGFVKAALGVVGFMPVYLLAEKRKIRDAKTLASLVLAKKYLYRVQPLARLAIIFVSLAGIADLIQAM